jgi:fatty-acyl-CoA synthase
MPASRFRESFHPAEGSTSILETTVASVLRAAATATPGRTALIEGAHNPAGRRRWTYAELLRDAERVARAMRAAFAPGERIAVWAPNIPEWVVLEFGAALAGLVIVTVNPAYKAKELEYVLRQSRASGLFFVPEFRGNPMAATLAEVRVGLPELRVVVDVTTWDDFLAAGDPNLALDDVTPDDAAQIQYTSGTTGFPKGALLAHRGITNNARLTAEIMGLAGDDVWVNCMPMFHTGGCVVSTLGMPQFGGAQILLPYFDPGLMLDLFEQEGGTCALAVPTMLIAMLEHPSFPARDMSSVKAIVSGGATVPPELIRRVQRSFDVTFTVIYGQTETSPVLTQTRPGDAAVDNEETVGYPLPQTEMAILDPLGEILPVDTVGEICCRGYMTMKEYFDNPQATTDTIDGNGWLHTGDLGTMDDRGYFKVTGRVKDMIIRGGENIYPREIEDVLFSHPDVGDVAVVGIPDERWGEIVAAFVRPAGGAPTDASVLFAYCREQLAPHKAPRRWAFVEEFPLTPSGKVQKFVLRDRYLAGDVKAETI